MANPFSAVPTPYRVDASGPPVVRKLRLGRVRHLRRAPWRRPHRDRVRRLRRRARGRGARRPAQRREPALPLPRPGIGLVGRHRLHLKRHEPLPVGRAHRALARRPSGRCDDSGNEARRARRGLVERSPRAGLAPPHARAEPGDPRRPRADRRRSGASPRWARPAGRLPPRPRRRRRRRPDVRIRARRAAPRRGSTSSRAGTAARSAAHAAASRAARA